MNPNDPQSTPFTETLPTALPYLPPRTRPVDKPVPSEGNSILVEQTALDSHQPRNAKTNGRPSLTRITIAVFTLGLSVPFIGVRRQHTTRCEK